MFKDFKDPSCPTLIELLEKCNICIIYQQSNGLLRRGDSSEYQQA